MKYGLIPGILLLSLFLVLGSAYGDEIKLIDGSAVRGKIIKETSTGVEIEISEDGAVLKMTIPLNRIRTITKGGKTRVVKLKSGGTSSSGNKRTQNVNSSSQGKSKKEIVALIDKAGTKLPEWWDSVPLSYPKTLDLTWKETVKGWKPDHKIGVYVRVAKNQPNKWKPAIRILHKSVEVNKGDSRAMKQSLYWLGYFYSVLLEDHARGAYWSQKGGDAFILSKAYYKLGSQDMARRLLAKFPKDTTWNGALVRMWSEIGELKTAIEIVRFYIGYF